MIEISKINFNWLLACLFSHNNTMSKTHFKATNLFILQFLFFLKQIKSFYKRLMSISKKESSPIPIFSIFSFDITPTITGLNFYNRTRTLWQRYLPNGTLFLSILIWFTIHLSLYSGTKTIQLSIFSKQQIMMPSSGYLFNF